MSGLFGYGQQGLYGASSLDEYMRRQAIEQMRQMCAPPPILVSQEQLANAVVVNKATEPTNTLLLLED